MSMPVVRVTNQKDDTIGFKLKLFQIVPSKDPEIFLAVGFVHDNLTRGIIGGVLEKDRLVFVPIEDMYMELTNE